MSNPETRRAGGTRQTIVDSLKRSGPQTAQQLADLVGVSTTAIRQHLTRLEAAGAVSWRDVRRGAGRPARHYHLTSEGHQERFPDRHNELAVDLLDSMQDVFGAEGLSRLVARRTERQRVRYLQRIPADGSLQQRVAELAAIRSEEGYMAEWHRGDAEPDNTAGGEASPEIASADHGSGFLLIEHHCPICDAAKVCRGLCSGELTLFRAVLGDGVVVKRVEHVLADGRRCVYAIRQRTETPPEG